MIGLDPYYEIILWGIAFSLVSTVLNNYLGIRKRMNEIQEEFKHFQKTLSEAAKSGDEARMKKAYEKNDRMNALMMEMMVLPWKTLVFALPLFFLFTGEYWLTHYPGLIPSLYPGFSAVLPFDLHLSSVYSLRVFQPATYGARGFFVVCVLFAGIIISFAEQNYKKLAGMVQGTKKQG